MGSGEHRVQITGIAGEIERLESILDELEDIPLAVGSRRALSSVLSRVKVQVRVLRGLAQKEA
jgi:hypothetical protein